MARVSRDFIRQLGGEAALFFRPFLSRPSSTTLAALAELEDIHTIAELRLSRHHTEKTGNGKRDQDLGRPCTDFLEQGPSTDWDPDE